MKSVREWQAELADENYNDQDAAFNREVIERIQAQARREALEEAAQEALRIWKNATNERPTFEQNALARGCTECAKAITALIPQEKACKEGET